MGVADDGNSILVSSLSSFAKMVLARSMTVMGGPTGSCLEALYALAPDGGEGLPIQGVARTKGGEINRFVLGHGWNKIHGRKLKAAE